MPESQVIEGTWEEVQLRAAGLKGQHVKLIVTDEPAPLPTPSEYPEAGLPPADEKQAAALAYFEARLKAAQSASSEEMVRGEREVAELMCNLNENPISAGELPVFPE